MQRSIPAVYMRGGTSKGLFFHAAHLPDDQKIRDRVILAAYGSPDPYKRQIDGVGGATSTTSKVAIISPSKDSGHHVDYLFGQVSIDRPVISYKGNCGNMSSAVGPFAIDEGLVQPEEPRTKVRIFQVNTRKTILAEVPVKEGRYDIEGDYGIDGVPGTGGRIRLRFLDPGGALTGKLLPTGNPRDVLDVPGLGEIPVSIVDASNPYLFVRARDVGLNGTETEQARMGADCVRRIEMIRGLGAVVLGLASSPEEAGEKSPQLPKIAVVHGPESYRTTSGSAVLVGETDLTARMMSMGSLHASYAVTGAVCTAGAARIEGSVVHEVLSKDALERDDVRIGHPAGVLSIGVDMRIEEGHYTYVEASLFRTARRLMAGEVYIPETCFR